MYCQLLHYCSCKSLKLSHNPKVQKKMNKKQLPWQLETKVVIETKASSHCTPPNPIKSIILNQSIGITGAILLHTDSSGIGLCLSFSSLLFFAARRLSLSLLSSSSCSRSSSSSSSGSMLKFYGWQMAPRSLSWFKHSYNVVYLISICYTNWHYMVDSTHESNNTQGCNLSSASLCTE